jgi:prepilin-type N-terminal cleavage/methylation domain-containing protein
MRNRKIKDNKINGFSLVELLVVLGIIGVLAGTVIASLTSSRGKARDAKRVSDMSELQKAFATYYHDCGQYPPIFTLTEDAGCTGGTTLGSYISAIPTNPTPGGIDYTYTYDGLTDTYVVDFVLEDQVNNLDAGPHTLDQDGIH